MTGLIRISPSCRRFTVDQMWKNGLRIHPAFDRRAFKRVEGVSAPRPAGTNSKTPTWLESLSYDQVAIPAFLRLPLSPAKADPRS